LTATIAWFADQEENDLETVRASEMLSGAVTA
jgi:hypothetical protein